MKIQHENEIYCLARILLFIFFFLLFLFFQIKYKKWIILKNINNETLIKNNNQNKISIKILN